MVAAVVTEIEGTWERVRLADADSADSASGSVAASVDELLGVSDVFPKGHM